MDRSDPQHTPEPGGSEAFREAYAALHELAESHFRRQPASHTLQPTALVHEAYLRIAGGAAPKDREHLLALASRAMRQILVDHARRKHAAKRDGGGHRVTLSGLDSGPAVWDVLELDEAIERLEQLDPRQARIVELRFFGGLTVEQAAAALGVSDRTVYLDWQMAKAWLSREFGADAP